MGMIGGFWPVLNRIFTACIWCADPAELNVSRIVTNVHV